jgi:hypothetical protein
MEIDNQEEVTMNRQRFVLGEIETLAQDMTALAESELRKEVAEEERLRKAKPDQLIMARPHDPEHLKAELSYFMARLNAVQYYLNSIPS